jgi:hypothetical protein
MITHLLDKFERIATRPFDLLLAAFLRLIFKDLK